MEKRRTILHGMGHKLNRRSKQYLALTTNNNIAPRLEIFDNEMSWRNNKKVRKLLDLSDLICVQELNPFQSTHGLGLYLETSFYGITFTDYAQKQKWFDEFNVVARRNQQKRQYPVIEYACQGKIKFIPKSLSKVEVPGDGIYRICFTATPHILIFNTSILSPTLCLEFESICDTSVRGSQLIWKFESSSPLGECEISIRFGDNAEAKYTKDRLQSLPRSHPNNNQRPNIPDIPQLKFLKPTRESSLFSKNFYHYRNKLHQFTEKFSQGRWTESPHHQQPLPTTQSSTLSTNQPQQNEIFFDLRQCHPLSLASFSDDSNSRPAHPSLNLSVHRAHSYNARDERSARSMGRPHSSIETKPQFRVMRSASTGFVLATNSRFSANSSNFIALSPKPENEEYMDMSGNPYLKHR